MSGRLVRFEFGPSEVLVALLRLRASASSSSWALGEGLREAVRAEFDAAAETLARLGSGIEWLEERDVAVVQRPPKKRGAKKVGAKKGMRVSEPPAYALPVEVGFDLRALTRVVREEGGNAEGPWHACASALYSLCEALHAGVYVSAKRPARLGREEVSFAVLRGLLPVPRKRKARVERAPASETSAKGAEPEARAQREETRAKTKRARARVESGGMGGFGGLPDDAESIEPDAPAMGPRGISVDAEHFLAAAGVAHWPCTREELERGRKKALARLHPDHAGEGSATAFHQAVRGHGELARMLEKTPTVAAEAVTAAPREEAKASTASDAEKPQRRRTKKPSEPVAVVIEAKPAAKPVRQWPPAPIAL